MSEVFLVYEDDYGGTFSPYVLTRIFRSLKEAEEATKDLGLMARIVKFEDRGNEFESYPKYNGGLYNE